MSTRSARASIDVNLAELDQIVEGGMRAPLSESDGQKLKAVLHALVEKATPRWRTTEKTGVVLGRREIPETPAEQPSADTEKSERAGHGRNSASVFKGARKEAVPHPELKPGDPCPECSAAKPTARKNLKRWYASWDSRRWKRRCTRWNGCAATACG